MIVQRVRQRILVIGQPAMVFGAGRAAAAPAWTPSDPTTDGGVSPEHWYRADNCYEDAARTTFAADDGDPVGSLTDKAANADHVSQATADNKPSLQTAELNGQPIWRFDGTNDYLQGAFTNGGALAQPNTVFIICKLNIASVNDGSNTAAIDGDDSTNRHLFWQYAKTGADPWAIYAGGRIEGGASDSDWHIWTIVFNGASCQFWDGGVSEASGNAGAAALDGLTVGAQYGGNYNWDGDIAEILIYGANLSDADKNELGNYAAGRYGLSYTNIV